MIEIVTLLEGAVGVGESSPVKAPPRQVAYNQPALLDIHGDFVGTITIKGAMYQGAVQPAPADFRPLAGGVITEANLSDGGLIVSVPVVPPYLLVAHSLSSGSVTVKIMLKDNGNRQP